MSLRLRSTYWLFFAILAAFLVVAVFGTITFINTIKIRDGEKMVARSFAVREAAHQLLSAMKDTETGERGYLLTGDTSHLDAYHDGIERAEERFRELQQLAKEAPEIDDLLVQLRDAFNKQQIHLAEAISLRQQQSELRVSDEVLNLVKSGRGKAAMDDARNVTRAILAAEGKKLAENEAATKFLSSLSQSLITAGNLITLTLILAAGFAAHVDRRKRDTAEIALLREQNELAAVIDSAFEGIITYSKTRAIRFINPAAAKILNVDREQCIGRSMLEFLPVDFKFTNSNPIGDQEIEQMHGTMAANSPARGPPAKLPPAAIVLPPSGSAISASNRPAKPSNANTPRSSNKFAMRYWSAI